MKIRILKGKNGFTLLEIIVATMIMGILVAIAIPNYNTMIMQGEAKAAQNNLLTLFNAEKIYHINNGVYYYALTLTDLNNNLSLNITDTNFSYLCGTNGPVTYFACIAQNLSDNNLFLEIENGIFAANTQIELPGGSTCPTGREILPNCNPNCTSDVATYCPT